MATNTAPTVKLSVGNSSKRCPLPSSVCINLVSAFSKFARRLIAAAAAGTQQHQIKLEFPCSDYWPPDAGGLYFVFEWLTRTQIQDGVLQFKQITKEVIQANQMPLTGLRFDQLLRIHEALLILEADNILAYQYKAVRGGIMNIVLNNVLRPADFAMLVRIFRAPPTLDMALVDVAISKAWQQLASGQMPFVTGCAAYRTIIQSQIPCPELYDFRKSIVSHIDTKLTLHEFCASLDFLCKADPTLGNHAVRTLVLKEVKDSAKSIELDKHAAVNPKLVMAICLIRFERDNKIQRLETQPPQVSESISAPQASFPQSQQLRPASRPQTSIPPPAPIHQPIFQPVAPHPINRLPNPFRTKSYHPSTLGPNCHQRYPGQPNGTVPILNTSIPATRFPQAAIQGNERITHGLYAALGKTVIGQPDISSALRDLMGDDIESEEELKERTRIAMSRSLMKFENGVWVQGESGQWET